MPPHERTGTHKSETLPFAMRAQVNWELEMHVHDFYCCSFDIYEASPRSSCSPAIGTAARALVLGVPVSTPYTLALRPGCTAHSLSLSLSVSCTHRCVCLPWLALACLGPRSGCLRAGNAVVHAILRPALRLVHREPSVACCAAPCTVPAPYPTASLAQHPLTCNAPAAPQRMRTAAPPNEPPVEHLVSHAAYRVSD